MECFTKTAAIAHQIQYFKDHYNLELSSLQPKIPTEALAQKGMNFYLPWKHLFIYMNKHFPFVKKKNLYTDCLKSSHIKFNFFIPLMNLKKDHATMSLLSSITNTRIVEISSIQFEYTIKKHRLYRHDKSSFDVYIQAKSSIGKRIGIGCKFRYSEGAGSTEKQLVSYETLGEAMQEKGEFDTFITLLFYPSGNTDHEKAVSKLKESLPEAKRNSLLTFTYERFIELGRKLFTDNLAAVKWLDYLQERYIGDEMIDPSSRKLNTAQKKPSTLES